MGSYKDKRFLLEQYINLKKSAETISKELNCSNTTIRKYLYKFNIPTRSISESHKGIKYKRKKGYKISKEHKENIKKNSLKGKAHPNYKHGKSLSINQCKECNQDITWKSEYCASCAKKLHWKQQSYIKKQIKARNTLPNKCESVLMEFLKEHFPEYLYVGRGDFIIDRYNPDFICETKRNIIELFGDYWHNLPNVKEKDENRINILNKNGYNVLVIWEHELQNLDNIKQKILGFHGGN